MHSCWSLLTPLQKGIYQKAVLCSAACCNAICFNCSAVQRLGKNKGQVQVGPVHTDVGVQMLTAVFKAQISAVQQHFFASAPLPDPKLLVSRGAAQHHCTHPAVCHRCDHAG